MNHISFFRHFCFGLSITVLIAGCNLTDPATPEEAPPLDAKAISSNTPINDDEARDLVFIREEEKLAHDVYTMMYDLWQKQIFANIAASEQKHMDAVLQLLVHYSITDPVDSNPVGVFVNEDIQALYDDLMTKGSLSLIDALEVGVIIEQTDIEDISAALARTDEVRITRVYEHLIEGSNNHLSSFTKLL